MAEIFSFTNNINKNSTDTENHANNRALECVAYLGKQFHKVADARQLHHALGLDSLQLTDWQLREAADAIGLHSKFDLLTSETAATLPLPALVELEQCWWVLLDANAGQFTVLNPITGKQKTQDLHDQYKILLVAEKNLTKKQVKFGLSWFYPSIFRQKKQLQDIFLLAIVLQLFALASPLLFENIIDKVLVGRSLSSLHVLGLAMLALAIAEPLYGFLRNTVFGHMASQINAELSGRLYRHLVGLPLPYSNNVKQGKSSPVSEKWLKFASF